MIHISIEGMDGVGKTTVCRLLAEKTGYKFVEKPLHYLLDKDENTFDEYIRIRDIVNANPDRNFTSLFYGLGSIYMYYLFSDKNIITDRHLASNFAWSGTDYNKDVYQLILDKIGKPKLTVILFCSKEENIKRLNKRDINDSDLKRVEKGQEIYNKMIDFCNEFKLPKLVIDATNLTPEEIVNRILKELQIND